VKREERKEGTRVRASEWKRLARSTNFERAEQAKLRRSLTGAGYLLRKLRPYVHVEPILSPSS
jgi:hypothetical protein